MDNVGETILDYFAHITLSVEYLAAITGILLFNKFKYSTAKYFIYFLIYVAIIVVIGRYSFLVKNEGVLSFLDETLLEKNYWWFTLFWKIVAVVFFGWYYSKILQNELHQKLLKISVLTFIVISAVIILFNLELYFTNTIPSIQILGAFIIMQCVFYYFMEILQSDKILTFHKSLNFYISCAILLFWLIKTPLAFFEPYYRIADMDYVNLRGYINLFIISFMYITYTIGLIVSKPEYD